MLLVSTNLSVPNDVDTLHITITRSGRSDPLSDQCYWLNGFNPGRQPSCAAASLPGTVALVASDVMSGLLKVHLELRQAGATGAVRVQRDAELQIPSEGLKQLPLPLDFLCLEANLPAPCSEGMTCRAGSCVETKIGQLADYVSTPTSSSCFDVFGCFGIIDGSNATVPQFDDAFGQCAIRGSYARDAPNVNLALIVNPARAGSLGACDSASGTCLVPLDQGPDGWTPLRNSKGDVAAIGFPDAVCNAVRSASILGVVIAPSENCGIKNPWVEQCARDATCVGVKKICPGDWAGYSCSGGVLPPTGRDQDVCGQVQTDPATGSVVPGLWCCSTSDPTTDNPLLIDDMSSGPLLKLEPEPGNAAGHWFAFSDDGNAVLSPPPAPALFTYRKIDPPVTAAPGAAPISHAACLRSDGFSGYVALEGFNLQRSKSNYQAVPFDVSRYTGFRFWAYSVPPKPGKLDLPSQIRIEVPDRQTSTEDPNSTCIQQGGRATCDAFGKVLTLPTDGSWALYTVKWAELEQQGYGQQFTSFDPHAYNLNFDVLGPGPDSRALPFDFCVAQIEFTQD